jgi:hypothetical protein
MMKVTRKAIVGVTTLIMMLPFTAGAYDGPCDNNGDAGTHIAAVITANDATTFYENPKHPKKKSPYTADLLEAKAMAAQAYVNDHKYSDAVSKLEGIVANVSKLLDAPKKKIDAYSGGELLDRSMEAIYCVVDLQ